MPPGAGDIGAMALGGSSTADDIQARLAPALKGSAMAALVLAMCVWAIGWVWLAAAWRAMAIAWLRPWRAAGWAAGCVLGSGWAIVAMAGWAAT